MNAVFRFCGIFAFGVEGLLSWVSLKLGLERFQGMDFGDGMRAFVFGFFFVRRVDGVGCNWGGGMRLLELVFNCMG